jgi:hypothetical protein
MNLSWLYFILLDPMGLATQGGSKPVHTEQDSIIIDWSVGQPISTAVFDRGYPIMISTGFIQNKNCDRCLYKNIDSFLISLKIGPNPVNTLLNIQLKQTGVIWQGIDMYSIEGKLIQRIQLNLSGMQLNYIMDCSHYLSGVYFIKCYFLIDQEFLITKIFQIHKT